MHSLKLKTKKNCEVKKILRGRTIFEVIKVIKFMIMNFSLRNFNRNGNTVYFQLLIDGYLEKSD